MGFPVSFLFDIPLQFHLSLSFNYYFVIHFPPTNTSLHRIEVLISDKTIFKSITYILRP